VTFARLLASGILAGGTLRIGLVTRRHAAGRHAAVLSKRTFQFCEGLTGTVTVVLPIQNNRDASRIET